jgi:dipeptidyl aminopeptidase/acylaminoacyl peptidase
MQMALKMIPCQKLLFAFSILLISTSISADTIPADRWLFAYGPDMNLPAFHETGNVRGEVFSVTDLFNFRPHDVSNLQPSENDNFPDRSTGKNRWVIKPVNDSGYLDIGKNSSGANSTAYLATYIAVDRWVSLDLDIRSRQRHEVYLNQTRLGSKSSNQGAGDAPGNWSRDLQLAPGKHRLLIRTFHTADDESPWQIHATIGLPAYADRSDIVVEPYPRQGKNINHLLDGVKAGNTSLSPDATLYAVNFSRTLPPSNSSENWFEIKRVSDGKLVHSFRHASISNLAWSPAGNTCSYITSQGGRTTIWLFDTAEGTHKPLIEDLADFGSYRWSPDGRFILYSISESIPADGGDFRRLLGMRDRLPGYRTRHFLYRVDIETGWRERLTHGLLTTSLHDISPDGNKILFSQSRPDYLERPYTKQDLFIMDLGSRQIDTIFRDLRWGVSGSFSPDGKKLLLTGGPSAFGEKGENIPPGMIPNNYDTQAYIYDLVTGVVDPFTREFDPNVSHAQWNRHDNTIYLTAGHEDYVHLFRYNERNRRFTRIETGEDVVDWIRMAGNQPYAVVSGSGISSPPRISLLNLRTGKYRDLENPERENFRHVVFGNTVDWDFKNADGTRIPGRIYFPPGFDESRTYPLIVYYYGGTNPVSRSFGGRYPFNMYAANGYVVYVLQPSGATGMGQKFSSSHVNNWGATVADEIIEGTRLFLKDHPFIDTERVGCMGASYGGFMTMLLMTRTDMFAAAISHAGISSISSYWGQGFWGYGYSAEASAESFPWNNRELYVDQSPLFSADRITTPLLLLHGADDTNVPAGESIQLYTALKLLGRPVELIKVEGEDHHILTYNRRIGWSNTKLAWFDKWLKGQSQWWDELYPEKIH